MLPVSAPRSTVSDPLLLKITISFLLKPFSFFWPLSCDIEFNIYQNIAVGSYNFFWSISYLRQSRDTRSHPLLMRSHPAPTASHLRVFFWPMLLSSKIDTISKRGCYHLASKVGLFLHSEQIVHYLQSSAHSRLAFRDFRSHPICPTYKTRCNHCDIRGATAISDGLLAPLAVLL